MAGSESTGGRTSTPAESEMGRLTAYSPNGSVQARLAGPMVNWPRRVQTPCVRHSVNPLASTVVMRLAL